LHAQVFGTEILLTASGELDIGSVSDVTALFAELMTPECALVVVDLSGVTFIDWAALRSLLAGARPDVELLLRSPSRPVRRLLELTELCHLVEVAQPLGPSQERVA
jgi:anti-anti-sigma factor